MKKAYCAFCIYRRGQLCGECEEGYAAYYHSENFQCGKCDHGAIGLLIYVVAELIPLAFLFAAIMIFKFKMMTGPMQSLLLFAQTITLINRTPSFIQLPQAGSTFIRIHTFLLGFLSFEFFHLDELSFCLWSGATVLDNLVFSYVTTLFAILFLGMFIMIVNHNSIKIKCCHNIIMATEKTKFFKNAVVHGIATFLVLSYTHYTVASFQILSRLKVYGEGGVTIGTVVHLQGNVDYFSVNHLPYAIPAVLVFLFLTIPPPLLLISYPLLWKIKAKCRHNVDTDNDTTVWPIHKLLPLIDSFQGVFRDSYRLFAGLFFLWRLILSAIYALSSSLPEFFFLTEIALLFFFTIHALIRPYKRQLYNVIDIMMLANMATINLITWYISMEFNSINSLRAVIAIKIMLMYIPVVAVLLVMMYWLLRRCNVVPESFHLPRADEDVPTISHIMPLQKRKESCVDEDLFIRAAELNSSPLALTANMAGFELRSRENLTASAIT